MYTIRPLHVGTISVDKSTLTYLRGFGQTTEVPCIMWAIQGAGRTIIVDTGPPSPADATRDHAPMTQSAAQVPERALVAAGIDRLSIETVIITHLHWDHAYNNQLFPRAEFFVQERELLYACNPLPVHARGYEAKSAGFSQAYIHETKWQKLDGDCEIMPGITALLTPGHSPGLQAVQVDTGSHPTILASDNVPLFENWQGEPPLLPCVPSAIHVDLREYQESLDRLRQSGARILPGHDFACLRS